MATGIDDLDLELECFLSDRAADAVPAGSSLEQPKPAVAASPSAVHDGGGIDKALEPTSYAEIAALAVGRSYHETAATPAAPSSAAKATASTPAIPDLLPSGFPEQARFLNSVRPWKSFFCPVSLPAGNFVVPRFRDNLYHFQTNYAVVFVACLAIEILLHPSALVSVLFTMAFWVFFMRKNSDPDWNPKVGSFQPGQLQRLLISAAITAVVLISTAGSTISGTALLYLSFLALHGLLHDPAAVANAGMDGMHVPL